MAQELCVIFELNRLSALDGWQAYYRFFLDHGYAENDLCDFYGDPVALMSVVKRIKRSHRNNFNIKLDHYEGFCGALTRYNYFHFFLKDVSNNAGSNLVELAERFIGKPGFVQAWLVDDDYDHWQNAYDPLQYTVVGRSLEGLPRVHNGLPPPLDQWIIDTSKNPGRRTIRIGYVEAVGAVMWLGDAFWPRVGKTKEEVTTALPKNWVTEGPGCIRIDAADELFTEATDVALQNKLRETLYPVVD